jgi:hypothetical protein
MREAASERSRMAARSQHLQLGDDRRSEFSTVGQQQYLGVGAVLTGRQAGR